MSQDGDEVFLSGKPGTHDQHVILRYKRTGQLLNTWQVKCGHNGEKCLLHLSIGGTSYITMSCWECRSILLYSMIDCDPITAYSYSTKDMAIPYAMCHGPDNTSLASNFRVGSREVLMYDVTSTQFTLKDRIPVDVNWAYNIHYMETDQHGRIVILLNWRNEILSAHSSYSGPFSKKVRVMTFFVKM